VVLLASSGAEADVELAIDGDVAHVLPLYCLRINPELVPPPTISLLL
jgi:hypothetical protein